MIIVHMVEMLLKIFNMNHFVLWFTTLSYKPGLQYDSGTASVTSVVSVTGKKFFHQSSCIPDIKFFDNLIGWTLANACDATLE